MANNTTLRLALLITGSLTMLACSQDNAPRMGGAAAAADLVITNGRIYTVSVDAPWAEAVAVRDGRYVYVGDAAGAQAFVGDATEVLDLGGAMAMPGINDAHVHPVEGAIKDLFMCNFAYSAGPDDIAAALRDCIATSPDAQWIQGGQWGSDFFIEHAVGNPRLWLDALSADQAIYLADDSLHNGWFNSKALALMGITADMATPPGLEILKDPKTGEPNGIILETYGFLKTALPDWSAEQYLEGARYAMAAANSYGITGIKGASESDAQIKGMMTVDAAGDMSVYYAASLLTPYGHRETPLPVAELVARRDTLGSEHVDVRFVKIFMDGVPTSSRTAAMLAPYVPANPGDAPTSGTLHVAPEVLTQDLIALDAAGFTVKIHTAGDRSVRITLDAIEAARKANGRSGLRHELAHAEYISPEDMPRFAELDAVADLSPYLWQPIPIVQSVLNAVGPPRAEEFFQVKTLLENDAPVLAGSDWPAAAVNMNPWGAIESMVTRGDALGVFPGTLNAAEAVTLAQALEIFTLRGAMALRVDDRSGSVEVGKSADLIVLDRNLFEVPISDVSDTQVMTTLFEGEVVFER